MHGLCNLLKQYSEQRWSRRCLEMHWKLAQYLRPDRWLPRFSHGPAGGITGLVVREAIGTRHILRKKRPPEPKDCNSEHPPPSTLLCPMNSKPWSLQLAKLCYTLKLAPLQAAEPSPPSLTPQGSNSHPTSSGFSISVVFVCTSHSLHVFVGTVALLTTSATNGQWSMVNACTPEETPSSAACAQPGVLRAWGDPLAKSAARICREGEARVAPLADLNIHTLSRRGQEVKPARQWRARVRAQAQMWE